VENTLGLQAFGNLFFVVYLAVVIRGRSATDNTVFMPVELPGDVLALARIEMGIGAVHFFRSVADSFGDGVGPVPELDQQGYMRVSEEIQRFGFLPLSKPK